LFSISPHSSSHPPQQRTTRRHWNANDETEFVNLLKNELEKIYKFQRKKTRELSAQIAAAEARVQSLVQEEEEERRHRAQFPPDVDEDNDIEAGAYPEDSDGDDDETDNDTGSRDEGHHSSVGSLSIEDQFRALEEDVATLVADVHDLALYSKLNFTGFIKIVKVRQTAPVPLILHRAERYSRNTM
jgi:SPX domain protein involved in polyphosphate accumulation